MELIFWVLGLIVGIVVGLFALIVIFLVSHFIFCLVLPERWYLGDSLIINGENRYWAWRAKLHRCFVNLYEIQAPRD